MIPMEPTTPSQPIGTPEALTPTQAQAAQQISVIAANKDHAYYKKDDPGHEAAVRAMANLHSARHPAPVVANPDAAELQRRDVPIDSHRPDAVVLPELPAGHGWDFETLDDLAKDVIRPLSLTQTQS